MLLDRDWFAAGWKLAAEEDTTLDELQFVSSILDIGGQRWPVPAQL